MAARMFDVPIALVDFVERDYVVTKARVGLEGEVSRGVSLCSLAVLRSDVTVFENAQQEPSTAAL